MPKLNVEVSHDDSDVFFVALLLDLSVHLLDVCVPRVPRVEEEVHTLVR